MAQKSYSKHREFKEYSSKGMVPYGDEQFDMMKSELLPNNKFGSLGKRSGDTQYHYEYKEERIPGGKYDRKDMRSVEEYTIPSQPIGNSSSYSYFKEEGDLNDLNSTPYLDNTPGYSKVRTTTTKKDMHQNIEELDSLLDDLQRDQERKLYKGGYTSDTVDSSSFDYKKSSTPLKPISPPSSGYSSLRRAERTEKRWLETTDEPASYNLAPARPPKPAEISTELYKEEKTESRIVPSQVSPAISHSVPAAICVQCHQPPGPLNKVTTTVKTYTYEVPVGSEFQTIPVMNEKLSEKMHREHTSYHTETTSGGNLPAPLPITQPIGGCQYCSHCNSRLTTTTNTTVVDHAYPPPIANETSRIIRSAHYESSSKNQPGTGPYPGERIIYPPTDSKSPPPINGTGPYGSTTYKFSESNYSTYNNRTDGPGNNGPGEPQLSLSPGPFPRPTTPSLGVQAPPKRIDDLMAEFPDAEYTPQNQDGSRRRVVAQSANQRSEVDSLAGKPAPPIGSSRNVAGPAVYYPPGELFTKREESSGAYQAGGGEMKARGKYKYEAESSSKMKESSRKAVVPICLPLCCAMPCSIL